MKKETVLKVLTNSCFLLPGNVKSKKGWFLSCTSFLSLVALAFSVASIVNEIVGYTNFAKARENSEAYKVLEHKPVRTVAFCLKPLKASDHLLKTPLAVDDEDANNASSKLDLATPKNNSTKSHKHGRGDLLEDIVTTAYKLLIFAVNILIRIFIWISFTTIVSLFQTVFMAQEGRPELQNSFMNKLWYNATKEWSSGEKVLLIVIILSQILREVEVFIKFNTSIRKTGLDALDKPCLIAQILNEQVKAIFARELVTEVVTFALTVAMKTLVNVLKTIAGQTESDADFDNEHIFSDTHTNEMNRKSKEMDGVINGQKSDSDLLFVKTQAMLMKAEMNRKVGKGKNDLVLPNGMTSIQSHISEIVGGYEGDDTSDLSMIFQTTQEKQISGGYEDGSESVDMIYSQMNFIISMYFELMTIWERAGRVTGFITLIMFCELTTTFCFNTYVTLDNAMEYGMMSDVGICGLLRGVVIITKFVCVCNAAQALRDMTPVLLDRVLKLKLQLLSLPSECYRRSSKLGGNGDSGGVMAPYDCERCRGLGSFLSEMVSYIRGHPFELSALGYFTVSRSTLTTITGVIVTYLVVLVQFQSYSSS